MASVPMSQLIVAFPKDDTAFAAFVGSTIVALDAGPAGPGQVQVALRRWHTRAQVRPRSHSQAWATDLVRLPDSHAGVRVEQDSSAG